MSTKEPLKLLTAMDSKKRETWTPGARPAGTNGDAVKQKKKKKTSKSIRGGDYALREKGITSNPRHHLPADLSMWSAKGKKR